jgi:hypothetical protein
MVANQVHEPEKEGKITAHDRKGRHVLMELIVISGVIVDELTTLTPISSRLGIITFVFDLYQALCYDHERCIW